MAAAVAKAGPIGPMQALPGTGGPEFFKVADKMGWQGSYTPEDFCSAYEVSKAVNNPVLVRSLPADVTTAQVELAAKAFGKARIIILTAIRVLLKTVCDLCMSVRVRALKRRYIFPSCSIQVTNVTIPKGQTFAFVTFEKVESADRCVAELATLAGSNVEVRGNAWNTCAHYAAQLN
jgi:hypothetical protein